MVDECILEKYLRSLLSGDRISCRLVIEEILKNGVPAHQVYIDVIWPIMVEIEKLYREGRIDSAQEAFASRINRTLVNQLQNKLPRKPEKHKKIVICTADNEQAELGGQMLTDLFESDGWETRFLGGSVCTDDILAFIHTYSPDILLLYGMNGSDAPNVRRLIDMIRDINAWPNMRIMLSGGVFGRAEGLWEEIGADLYAPSPEQAVQLADMDRAAAPMPQKTIKQKVKAAAKPAVSSAKR
ncbi:MAG: B12-binding domain-containing protein [Anaerohalosphaeraceae bacterium]